VGVQRTTENLSEERRRRLDELGFVWDPFAADWEKGLLHLKAYKEREGHCRVPLSRKENGFRLGQWVNVQRANKGISEERAQPAICSTFSTSWASRTQPSLREQPSSACRVPWWWLCHRLWNSADEIVERRSAS
jgi:hypothetical protein